MKAWLKRLFGEFTWQAPAWVNRTGLTGKRFGLGLLGVIAIVIVSWLTIRWYQSLPQPEQLIAKITTPELTPNEVPLTPNDLTLDFGVIRDDEFMSQSAAPLNLVGKNVKEGITITPTITGQWLWDSDSHLIFTPKQDWAAGQTYTIQFADQAISSKLPLKTNPVTFTTHPFTATITDFKFFQDPNQANLKEAVATVQFSYPVDVNSFEKRINLFWQQGKTSWGQRPTPFKFTVSYDDNKRTAYIHSEPLSLPSSERYLELNLDKGIKPAHGPDKTPETLISTTLIPDATSFFKVEKVAATIVRNASDRPGQVLAVETSLGLTTDELSQSIHAYLLPKDYPPTSVEPAKENYQWNAPGEITPAILSISQPINLNALPADRDYASLHSFQFQAPTPRFMYIKIAAGTRGFGGYRLAHDYVQVLPVPTFPQEISFLHKGALLALGTEEKLSVAVRGLKAVRFSIARVFGNSLNHLVTQTNGDFSNPYFRNSDFNQENISTISTDIQDFNNMDPSAAQYTALDIGHYLSATRGGQKPLGLFLLQAQGYDPVNKWTIGPNASRLILITDLGLIAKDNLDNTHDVYVVSINQGLPVSGVNVAILGKNGLPLFTVVTDASGHATLPSVIDFTGDRQPVVYVATHGSDVSFMPYQRADRQLNYSRFDIAGVTNANADQTPLVAYVFSDRGIYRPGDVAHLGLVIRKPFAALATAGSPLQFTITDSRGVNVKDETISVPDDGFMTYDFKTDTNAPTGTYNVNLYIVKDNRPSSLIGSTTINLAEFSPDRLRINTTLAPTTDRGWINPLNVKANVSLYNLYGTPASKHRIGGKIILSPENVHFKTYPDYTFVDPLINPKAPPKVFSDTLKATETNAEGKAQFDLHLERFEKATYELSFFAEGFEAEGGRSVTAQTKVLVSPLSYLVGYKPDGDLKFIGLNSERKVHFININQSLLPQALTNLNLHLIKVQPVTTLVKKEDGSYQYQSIVQTNEINRSAFAIGLEGADYTLPTAATGDYQVKLTDASGLELSHFNFSVVGSGSETLPKNAEMTVKLDKSTYNPGDLITLQINSPYIGAGLITIERDKVYAAQWFKTTSTSSLQTIRLPADFKGDGYINVSFVRDLNSPDMFSSPLSYSVQPFSASHAAETVKVQLTVPKVTKPGAAMTITYSSDKPGKAVIFAVDEGILQVASYKTPNPLDFFFAKHALEVNTYQIVDQILPRYLADREKAAVGGDINRAALAMKMINPFKRRVDKAVVFWSSEVDIDATKRQLTFTVPDYFNGTLRVMAVAVSQAAVGSASIPSTVRGPFVIQPNTPNFVAPGDTFEVSASIANNVKGSGANAQVTVHLTVPNVLSILGGNTQTITIPEGQEGSARFKVKANAQLGAGDLHFTASINKETTTMRASLSVRPETPFDTTLQSGMKVGGTQSLTLNRDLYSADRSVQAALSTNPLILATGLNHYLEHYPYGCTEQLVSQAFPLLAMTDQPWFTDDAKHISDRVKFTIQQLGMRQTSTGAFNYWPEIGIPVNNQFSSVYAMHFLTEARAAQYDVPNDVFTSGIRYLRDVANQSVTDLNSARLHAYAIYVLTRNELVTTNYLTHLQADLDQQSKIAWKDDITSAYLAATYRMLNSNADAEKLIGLYKPNQTAVTGPFYDGAIGNAEYLYLIAKHFPERLKRVDESLIQSLVDKLNDDSISTVLSAYTTLGLAAWGDANKTVADNGLLIQGKDAAGKTVALTAADPLFQIATVTPDIKQVLFSSTNKVRYFYQITQAGYDKKGPTSATKQGIEVVREYHDAADQPLKTVHVGDDIIVHVRVRATDEQYHENVAVLDLLPGGFDVTRDSVNRSSMDYADIREDRVIFFGTIEPKMKEMIYKMKATTVGHFSVPGAFAESMYNPMVRAAGVASELNVEPQIEK